MRLLFLFLALTNASPIVKKNLHGLQNGLSYQSPVQTSPGGHPLSAYARNPCLTHPCSAPTTPTTSSSACFTATTTPSATPAPTSTHYATSSSSTSADPSSTPTPYGDNSISSPTITPSPNRTLAFPPDHHQATSDVLSLVALCFVGFLFYTHSFQTNKVFDTVSSSDEVLPFHSSYTSDHLRRMDNKAMIQVNRMTKNHFSSKNRTESV